MKECYEFIAAEEGDGGCPWSVTKMCVWLGVSRSGYYEWKARPPSPTARRRSRLKTLIRAIFGRSRGTYGYRRVHAVLRRSGEDVGPELVRALMVELGLVACQPRPFRTTTVPDAAGAAAVGDRLGGDFSAEQPGCKLVGDITYIDTWEGWLYLATVIDCYSKRIVGWSMANHMRTDLVVSALDMAAGNVALDPDAVFHSDRGTQYISYEHHRALARHGISPSVGRTGICWDNALAESVFAALKNELVHRTVFPTRRHARRAIAEYIEVFYNRQRLHSSLDYRTPHEVHTGYLESQMAA